MPVARGETKTLSVHRTFLVQLYANEDKTSGGIAGRAEHIASGAVATFDSIAELLKFFTRFDRRPR
jgi:hypothetical protein